MTHKEANSMIDFTRHDLPEYHDDEYPVWREVQVCWCHARRWVVRALPTRNDWADYLDDFATQKEAIDEALMYAFDTSCGAERAERVVIYTKNDDIKKIITEAEQLIREAHQ